MLMMSEFNNLECHFLKKRKHKGSKFVLKCDTKQEELEQAEVADEASLQTKQDEIEAGASQERLLRQESTTRRQAGMDSVGVDWGNKNSVQNPFKKRILQEVGSAPEIPEGRREYSNRKNWFESNGQNQAQKGYYQSTAPQYENYFKPRDYQYLKNEINWDQKYKMPKATDFQNLPKSNDLLSEGDQKRNEFKNNAEEDMDAFQNKTVRAPEKINEVQKNQNEKMENEVANFPISNQIEQAHDKTGKRRYYKQNNDDALDNAPSSAESSETQASEKRENADFNNKRSPEVKNEENNENENKEAKTKKIRAIVEKKRHKNTKHEAKSKQSEADSKEQETKVTDQESTVDKNTIPKSNATRHRLHHHHQKADPGEAPKSDDEVKNEKAEGKEKRPISISQGNQNNVDAQEKLGIPEKKPVLNVQEKPLLQIEENSKDSTDEDEEKSLFSNNAMTPDEFDNLEPNDGKETTESSPIDTGAANDIEQAGENTSNQSSEEKKNEPSDSDSATLRHVDHDESIFDFKAKDDKGSAEVQVIAGQNDDKLTAKQNQILKDYESDEFVAYLVKKGLIKKSDLMRNTNQDGYFEIPLLINNEIFVLAHRKWMGASKSNGVLLTLFLPVSACFFLAMFIYMYINDRLIQKMNKGLQRLMKIENQSGKMFEFKMIENFEYIHVNVNMSYFNHNFNSNMSRVQYNNILMSGGTNRGEPGINQVMDSIDVSAITLQLDEDLQMPALQKTVEVKSKKYILMKRKKNIAKKRKQDTMVKRKMYKYIYQNNESLIDKTNPILKSPTHSLGEGKPLKGEGSAQEIKVCFDNKESDELGAPVENRKKEYMPLDDGGDTKIQISSYGNLEIPEKESEKDKKKDPVYEI